MWNARVGSGLVSKRTNRSKENSVKNIRVNSDEGSSEVP
jgi:hypothetical protein